MQNQRYQLAQQWVDNDLDAPDPNVMKLLWHIVDEGTLGASNQIQKISELLVYMANKPLSRDMLWRRLEITGRFIERTRGKDAPIIANYLRWILSDVRGKSSSEIHRLVSVRASQWESDAKERLDKLIATGCELLDQYTTLLLFDYSSTVSSLVKEFYSGSTERPEVVVFESRALNGGRPYVADLLEAEIPIKVSLDVAIDHECHDAAVVLLGVESLLPDGSLINTIGSRLIARTARIHGGDVYGCCDILKLDTRAGNVASAAKTRNFDDLLMSDGEERLARLLEQRKGLVNTALPELEVVPPDLVTGYITDRGIVRPWEIREWEKERQEMVAEERDE